MLQLNDLKLDALQQQTGMVGDIDDLEWEWLIDLTGAGPDNTINDLWTYLLMQEGYYDGNLNDRQFDWLGGLGYAGQLMDRWYQFWQGGGVVGAGIRQLVITATARDEMVVTFTGIPGGSLNGGVTYTVDGGPPQTFISASAAGNSVTYTASADFEAGQLVRWLYAPGNITVDGEPLDAQDRLVDNQIPQSFETIWDYGYTNWDDGSTLWDYIP
jgi:hypothetical protein